MNQVIENCSPTLFFITVPDCSRVVTMHRERSGKICEVVFRKQFKPAYGYTSQADAASALVEVQQFWIAQKQICENQIKAWQSRLNQPPDPVQAARMGRWDYDDVSYIPHRIKTREKYIDKISQLLSIPLHVAEVVTTTRFQLL